MTHEELWLSERPKIEEYLRRWVSREAAQDIVDEAFARLKGSSPTPRTLWKTALLIELEHRRAETKQIALQEQAGLRTGTAIPSIDTAIIRADFDRAFRRLPRAQQEAFALIELRGLTERETAEVLGIPRGTANWRCEAARNFLRGELA